MLLWVLVIVYRAFFRSMDGLLEKDTSLETQTTSQLLSTTDPFRDTPSEFPIAVDSNRVQVLGTTQSVSTNTSPTVIQQPVVIDGLRFHATSDLFDGNESNTGSLMAMSSIPGMYLRQGQQKILSYLWLASSAKIIYKDVYNTHFCLLSSFDITQWTKIIQKLWWSVLAISSQIDRNSRWLFGDNAYLLTIPKYRSTKMIALIQYRNDRWYIQMDKDRYDEVGKDFIKNTLPQYYTTK